MIPFLLLKVNYNWKRVFLSKRYIAKQKKTVVQKIPEYFHHRAQKLTSKLWENEHDQAQSWTNNLFSRSVDQWKNFVWCALNNLDNKHLANFARKHLFKKRQKPQDANKRHSPSKLFFFLQNNQFVKKIRLNEPNKSNKKGKCC